MELAKDFINMLSSKIAPGQTWVMNWRLIKGGQFDKIILNFKIFIGRKFKQITWRSKYRQLINVIFNK